MLHRNEAQRRAGQTEKQKQAQSLGREPGTNHLQGIPKSEASKSKRSIAHKKWCSDNRDKVKARGQKIRGENHYNWKGGSGILNQDVRRMTEHRKWMDSTKERDGMCMNCGSLKELESHHIKPLANIINENNIKNIDDARECEELWDISNGITYCRECHSKIHNRKYTPIGNGRRQNVCE